MFKDLKLAVQKQIALMQQYNLFTVEVDRDKIFQLYLDGFPEDQKQEHNCNCCKSFLRQYAGIVTIIDNKMVSIWDINVKNEHKKVVKNLKEYIHSLPISSVYFNNIKQCGTDTTFDIKRSLTWNHFYFELDRKFVRSNNEYVSTLNSSRGVFKRSLEEITVDSLETVLELIDQNSLYRGKEFESTIKKFLIVKKQYEKLKIGKELFCWDKFLEVGIAVSKIRNSAIGTLLINLSEDMDLELAISKYEKVVAPTNYKRPTALVTNKMVKQAKEKINELGLLESLNRRHANLTDVSVENLVFTDKTTQILDVFSDVANTKVNPKKLNNIEEITIENFLSKVANKASSIEVLVENRHLPNFVSLIAPEDKDTKPLFKWANNFSWHYSGGITDSIKEKVKNAGGKVDGYLRASLAWNNGDDLDIHCKEPDGKHIYFRNKSSSTSGKLDVDMNAGGITSKNPVENITWSNPYTMLEGVYSIKVHNYTVRTKENQGYTVQIECDGEIFEFNSENNPIEQKFGLEIVFSWSKKDGIKFSSDVNSSVFSKEKWNIKTNNFVKVKQVMLSPNYWQEKIGNKHYFFMLDNCIADEKIRPFFNEFLKEDLNSHRKVLEILGSKVKIEETPNQLSGIGFSETQKNSVIVKVSGKTERLLKVTF